MTPTELYRDNINYLNELHRLEQRQRYLVKLYKKEWFMLDEIASFKETEPTVITAKDLAILVLLTELPQRLYLREFHIDKKLTRVTAYLEDMEQRGLITILGDDDWELKTYLFKSMFKETVTAYSLGKVFGVDYSEARKEAEIYNKERHAK